MIDSQNTSLLWNNLQLKCLPDQKSNSSVVCTFISSNLHSDSLLIDFFLISNIEIFTALLKRALKKVLKDFDEKEHINRTFEIELIGLSEIRSNPINILIIIQCNLNPYPWIFRTIIERVLQKKSNARKCIQIDRSKFTDKIQLLIPESAG